MNETRWNSRYEMAKRVIQFKVHIDNTINYFSENQDQLPSHIKLEELNYCSLSAMELDGLKDIEILLERASKYGNNMKASTIPTISRMYWEAFTPLPDLAEMTTDISRSVYNELEAGIKSRWSFTPPTPTIAPIAIDNRPILAKKISGLEAEIESIWTGESGTAHKTRARDTILAELTKDYKRADKEGIFESMDFFFLDMLREADHVWTACDESTSCEAERVFSKAGYITSNRRSGLSTDHIRFLLFSSSMKAALKTLHPKRKPVNSIASTAK
ncbi:hypothetical protein FBU30_002125 [Linnemannia zychae]|nr:hypothetical protein FBU30_002125 [Linnemannia zychae]